MNLELSKPQVKSLTVALHAAMKANPKMKLSEFRENFSKEVNSKDWNTLLDSLTDPAGKRTEETYDYDYSEYDVSSIFEMNVGRLSPVIAKELIEVIYKSEFWFLAPIHDGIFESKEQAHSFVEQHPTVPLSLVVSTNSSLGSVSVIINTEGNDILIREEDENMLIERYRYESVSELIKGIPALMTTRAHDEHDSDDSYAIPYLLKDSRFINYVNKFEYNESECGVLSKEVANAFIDAVDASGRHYLSSLDGEPFYSTEDARLFVNTFENHPLIVVSITKENALGVSTTITSNLKSSMILLENNHGLSSRASKSFNGIDEAIKGFTSYADISIKSQHPMERGETYPLV